MRNVLRFLPLLALFALLAMFVVPGALPTPAIQAAPRMAPTAAPTPPAAQVTGKILTIPAADYVLTEVPELRSIEFQLSPTSNFSGTGILSATLSSTGLMTATGNLDSAGVYTTTNQTLKSAAGPITNTQVITISWNQDNISVPWNIKAAAEEPVEITLHYAGASFKLFDFLVKRVAPMTQTAGFNDGAPVSAARTQQNLAGSANQSAPTAVAHTPAQPPQPTEPTPPAGPNTTLLLVLIVLGSGVGLLAAFRIRTGRWPIIG